MNRYLAVPLCIFLVGFVGAYSSQATLGKNNERVGKNIEVTNNTGQKSTQIQEGVGGQPDPTRLLSHDEIRTRVLDGWPTVGNYRWGSRGAPRTSVYAELSSSFERRKILLRRGGEQEHAAEDAQKYYLTSLVVGGASVRGLESLPTCFPIHADCQSQEIKIFADQEWQSYEAWRDENLPKYLAVFKTLDR